MIDPTTQIIIVTGAGTGIGRAVARRFAAAGSRITLVGRRREPLEETATGLDEDRVLVAPCDVADREAIGRTLAQTVDRFGTPNVLINNAGYNTRPRSVAEVAYEEWDRMIGINLTGAFNFARAVLPGMRELGFGTIVNVSSIAGKVATELAGAAYCAAKHGVVSLTASLNEEEARNGIRSTALCPGETETPILDSRPEPVSAERRAQMLQPEDVAECVFLAATLPERASIREMIVKPRIAYV